MATATKKAATYNSDHDPVLAHMKVDKPHGTADVKFDLIHASGDTFMAIHKTQKDARNLMGLGALIITITEAGEQDTIQALRETVATHNSKAGKDGHTYTLINPDKGDIAFLVRGDALILDKGGPLAIPGTHGVAPKNGGHGPRHNSWVRVHWQDEVITHTGVHLVTLKPDPDHDREERQAMQIHQLHMVADQMSNMAAGRMLATGSGDLNGNADMRKDMVDLFRREHMTTTSKETKTKQTTHGNARLDFIWTMDRDGRLSCTSMRVLKG